MSYTNRITLSKVTYSAKLSEETAAFSATVLFDGQPLCIASNNGHGGCDRIVPLPGKDYPSMREAMKAVDAWIATLPEEHYQGISFNRDIESVISDALHDHLLRKDLVRAMKKKLLYVKQGQQGIFQVGMRGVREMSLDMLNKLRAHILSQHPGAKILNDLTEDQALALYREGGDTAVPAAA